MELLYPRQQPKYKLFAFQLNTSYNWGAVIDVGPSALRLTQRGYLSQGSAATYGDRACNNVQIKGQWLVSPDPGIDVFGPYSFESSTMEDGNVYTNRWMTYRLYYNTTHSRWDDVQLIIQRGEDFSFTLCTSDVAWDVELSWLSRTRLQATYALKTQAWYHPFKPGSIKVYTYEIPEYDGLPRTIPTGLPDFQSVRFPSPGELDISHDWAMRLRQLMQLGYDAFPWTDGDLCQEAVDGCKAIDINTTMYLMELAQTGKMIKSTLASVKDVKRNPVKAVSDLYLSYHYGYRLSWRDTVTLVDAAKRDYRRSSSLAATRARRSSSYEIPDDGRVLHGSIVTEERCVKVWYDPVASGAKGFLSSLFKWDLFPELNNVWDMVPYSFVVDWLIPLGQALEQIDYHTYASTLNVVGVVRSTKLSIPQVLDPAPLVQGLVQYGRPVSPFSLISYQRTLGSELSYPTLHVDLPDSFSNWIPAAALILQRTK